MWVSQHHCHSWNRWTCVRILERRRESWSNVVTRLFVEDMPCCRTMIYGYNASLSSRGIDTILDYSRGFLEEIKNVRRGKEVNLAFRDSRLSMTRDCSKLFVDYTISCLSRQRIPAPFLYCARFRQELHLHRAGKNTTAFFYHPQFWRLITRSCKRLILQIYCRLPSDTVAKVPSQSCSGK